MARHDTWMPLYVGDYLADTLHLTTRQHGAYLLLLMHAWRNGGKIPTIGAAQAVVARLPIKEWAKDAEIVLELFDFDPAGKDGIWHQRVRDELAVAEAMTAQRSKAGKASAAKRERERQRDANENPTPVEQALYSRTKPSQSPSPSPDVTTTLTVTPSGSAGRATLLPDGWMPDEADVVQLRKGRPEIVGELYDRRMQDFRDWTKASAKTSHDWPATWRGFMRQTKLPPESKFTKPADASMALPPAEPWEQRMRGYKPGGFWKPNDWGPPPESPSTRVPAPILAAWRQQGAAA